MAGSIEELRAREDLVQWREQIERKLRSIASKPQIARVMTEYRMVEDPLAEANSLSEHFLFLLRLGVAPEKITLRVISSPKWFRRSLELRKSGASQKMIFWTLTDQGRLCLEGSSPGFGRVIPWVFNKLVDLLKESALSTKIWSGILFLFFDVLCVTSFRDMVHGQKVLFNALLVIVGFFSAAGFGTTFTRRTCLMKTHSNPSQRCSYCCSYSGCWPHSGMVLLHRFE
ncbi:MAG: hypothetical protein WB949_17385 [Candidatus Acidiferrales bacterium]